MFKVECCKKKIRCRTWVLADSKSRLKLLKQAICPVCGQKLAIVERFLWNSQQKIVRKSGDAAEDLIEKVSCDILYELISLKASEKYGFYLNYSEYGKVKKCYSNLSALKLGIFRGNFDDVCIKSVRA